MTVAEYVEQVRKEFTVSDDYLEKLVHNFVGEAQKGLEKDLERGIPMIPSFATSLPNGSEKGLYLAADLGGSNFRVCSIRLNGDSTHSVEQMKWKVPDEVMKGTGANFWNFLSDRVVDFLKQVHPENVPGFIHSGPPKDRLLLGFTFSFPVHQTALNRGTLIRWTKGYAVEEAVGQDVCLKLQEALDERKLPIEVAALVNDTVGCMLARSYETGTSSQTVVGSILGTGTNAAYSEKISQIKKLAAYPESKNIKSKIMVVNTEWGSFDNDVKFLPNTEVDKAINLATPNPDFHMFEKRVSGMFLGEITRRILERAMESGELFAESKETTPMNSNLFRAWSTDTSFLSLIAADETKDFEVVNQELWNLGVCKATLDERRAVRDICHIVALRSARLVAGIIAGLLVMTDSFSKFEVIDIGMDGAVIEYYPHYEQLLREAWRSIPSIGEAKEKRITIGLSKDGSGIGAALCAAMSENA